MGFIRETSKRHFVGLLCVISADLTDLLPVKLLVPEFERGVLIAQSIYIVRVVCPFENVKKNIFPICQRFLQITLQLMYLYILRVRFFRGTLWSRFNYTVLTNYVNEEIWKYSSKVRSYRTNRPNNKYVEMHVTLRAAVGQVF